jgi:hypothetical protein
MNFSIIETEFTWYVDHQWADCTTPGDSVDDDDDDDGAVGGIRIGRGSQSTLRKSAPVPLFPP